MGAASAGGVAKRNISERRRKRQTGAAASAGGVDGSGGKSSDERRWRGRSRLGRRHGVEERDRTEERDCATKGHGRERALDGEERRQRDLDWDLGKKRPGAGRGRKNDKKIEVYRICIDNV